MEKNKNTHPANNELKDVPVFPFQGIVMLVFLIAVLANCVSECKKGLDKEFKNERARIFNQR